MCSWKLAFRWLVFTGGVFSLSLAGYDARNSSRTAPTSLSIKLACTHGLHIVNTLCSMVSYILMATVRVPKWSSHQCSTSSSLASRSLSEKCSSVDVTSGVTACRRKSINPSSGAGIMFYSQFVEWLARCS